METYCDIFLQGPLSKSDAIAQAATAARGDIDQNYIDFKLGSLSVKENLDRTENVSVDKEFLNYNYRLEIEFEPGISVSEASDWIKNVLITLRSLGNKAVPVCSYYSEIT